MVSLEQVASQEQVDQMEHLELLAKMVLRERQEHQVNLELRGHTEHQVKMVQQVHRYEWRKWN